MTIANATTNSVPKGISSLEKALGGGLPESLFDVIAGPPGCCKTALEHQMTFALTTLERPVLYFEGLSSGSPTRSQSMGQHVSERDGG